MNRLRRTRPIVGIERVIRLAFWFSTVFPLVVLDAVVFRVSAVSLWLHVKLWRACDALNEALRKA